MYRYVALTVVLLAACTETPGTAPEMVPAMSLNGRDEVSIAHRIMSGAPDEIRHDRGELSRTVFGCQPVIEVLISIEYKVDTQYWGPIVNEEPFGLAFLLNYANRVTSTYTHVATGRAVTDYARDHVMWYRLFNDTGGLVEESVWVSGATENFVATRDGRVRWQSGLFTMETDYSTGETTTDFRGTIALTGICATLMSE